MGNIKTLGLAAVAAMALMAFTTGSSSATTLYTQGKFSPEALGTGTTLDFSIPSGGSATLATMAGETLDKCSTSTIKGTIENAGGANATVTSGNRELTWGNCSFPTKTLQVGKFEWHWSGMINGTLTAAENISVTINTILFGSCVFGVTKGDDLGTYTGGIGAGTFHMLWPVEKFSGGASCPSTAKWTGTYTSTEPSSLWVG